jgi:hypothetical protein
MMCVDSIVHIRKFTRACEQFESIDLGLSAESAVIKFAAKGLSSEANAENRKAVSNAKIVFVVACHRLVIRPEGSTGLGN